LKDDNVDYNVTFGDWRAANISFNLNRDMPTAYASEFTGSKSLFENF